MALMEKRWLKQSSIIGIDFDNTIVNYDKAFYKAAREWQIIPESLPQAKLAVRNYLHRRNEGEVWTKLQGYVYGTLMDEAELFLGCGDFLTRYREKIFVISHKTVHPIIGPRWNLHAAARAWIETHLSLKNSQIFFETTIEEKIKRIQLSQCDVFIDDLPEILLHPQFPKSAIPLLFDPEKGNALHLQSFSSWKELC